MLFIVRRITHLSKSSTMTLSALSFLLALSSRIDAALNRSTFVPKHRSALMPSLNTVTMVKKALHFAFLPCRFAERQLSFDFFPRRNVLSFPCFEIRVTYCIPPLNRILERVSTFNMLVSKRS